MTPDASRLDTRPQYAYELVASTRMTQKDLAAQLGVSERTIRRWLSGDIPISYPQQFTLEALVLGL